MERYQVILAYDGSHYKGYQRQTNVHTVQGVVEESLRKLSWQGVSILAAGRTDTGTHASGQVIAFDLEWDRDPQKLRQALNGLLPKDVVAREVKHVCSTFHPRFDASWRKYLYRIYCQPVRDPFLEPYSWRIWPAIELLSLSEIAQPLIGTHDFRSFGTPPHTGGNTVRHVLKSGWKQEASFLVYEIVADAFLYHMVRRVVFTQLRIAQGKLELTDLVDALKPGSDSDAVEISKADLAKRWVHGLAPAQGLILAEIHYPEGALRLDEDIK